MADLHLAASYVDAHGTALDRARVAALLGRPADTERAAAVATVGRDAGPHGGFPATWAAGAQSVGETCGRLEVLHDLGADGERVAVHARQFLAASQDSAGAVAEGELLVPLAPEWADPTRPAARRYLTALAGRWLVRDGAHRSAAARCAAYLALLVEETVEGLGSGGDYPATAWLAAAVLRGTDDAAAAEPLLRAVAALVEDLGPESLAGLADAVPDADVANAARFRLQWRQEEDGRWASEQGPDRDLAATLGAVRALRGHHL